MCFLLFGLLKVNHIDPFVTIEVDLSFIVTLKIKLMLRLIVSFNVGH